MAEVYGNDNTIYNSSTDYIKYRGEAQAYRDRFHISLEQAGIANDYASILSNKPRPPALALLMGTGEHVLWARCEPPPNYYNEPLSSPYILFPDLDGFISKLMAAVPELQEATSEPSVHSGLQAQQGSRLVALIETASDQNKMIFTVRAAMESFLKG